MRRTSRVLLPLCILCMAPSISQAWRLAATSGGPTPKYAFTDHFELTILDVADWQIVKRLQPPSGGTFDELTFGLDGKILVTAEYDELRFWDTTSWVAASKKALAPIRSLVTNRAGNVLLVSRSNDFRSSVIDIWDLDAQNLRQSIPLDFDCREIRLSGDAARAYVLTDDHRVVAVELQSGAVTEFFKAVYQVAYDESNEQFAVDTEDGVLIWNLKQHRKRSVLSSPIKGFFQLTFAPGGAYLLGYFPGSGKGLASEVYIWDLERPESPPTCLREHSASFRVCFLDTNRFTTARIHDGIPLLQDIRTILSAPATTQESNERIWLALMLLVVTVPLSLEWWLIWRNQTTACRGL